jgi:hypothetical protein
MMEFTLNMLAYANGGLDSTYPLMVASALP